MCDLDLTPFDLNIQAIKTKFTIHVVTSQVSFQQKVIWILSFSEQPAGWPWPLTMWPQNIWWKIRVGFDIWQCDLKMTTLFTKRGYLLHESRNLTVTKWKKVFTCITKWVCGSLINSRCAAFLDEGSGWQPPIVISTTIIIMCLSCFHPFLIAGFTKTKCFLKSIGPVTKNILPIQWKIGNFPVRILKIQNILSNLNSSVLAGTIKNFLRILTCAYPQEILIPFFFSELRPFWTSKFDENERYYWNSWSAQLHWNRSTELHETL